MADTIPHTAVGSKASELCKAMIRELLMGQSVEGYCGNCVVIRNAKVPAYEVSTPLVEKILDMRSSPLFLFDFDFDFEWSGVEWSKYVYVLPPTNTPNQNITIPILILAGAEDKSAPLDGCKRMFEQIPGEEKKLVVLDGVGHWHCLEVGFPFLPSSFCFFRWNAMICFVGSPLFVSFCENVAVGDGY